MTKLKVIVGFVVAAAATMAVVKTEHLRVSDDERILVGAAEEAAFLDSFSSIDADSLSDDTWRTNKTVDSSSDLDSLDDILDNSSSSKEPIPKPNATKATQDHSVKEPTAATAAPASGGAASEPLVATKPAGSVSAGSATETPTSSFAASTLGVSANDDASSVADTPATELPTDGPGTETPTSTTTTTDVPTTDTPMSDATDTPNAATYAPGAIEAPTSTTAAPSVTEPNGTPSNPPVLVGTTTETPATETPSTSPMNSDQLSQVGAWEQCGGLGFDYTKYFADGISPIWQTKLSCVPGHSCEEVNPWYFQCQPIKDISGVELWGQCGGANYSGLTSCTTGAACKYVNDWYSQCVPSNCKLTTG